MSSKLIITTIAISFFSLAGIVYVAQGAGSVKDAKASDDKVQQVQTNSEAGLNDLDPAKIQNIKDAIKKAPAELVKGEILRSEKDGALTHKQSVELQQLVDDESSKN